MSVMKALLISASPREGGNSDTAARTVDDVLQRTVDTEFIRVADYNIRHCYGMRVVLEAAPMRHRG